MDHMLSDGVITTSARLSIRNNNPQGAIRVVFRFCFSRVKLRLKSI